MSLFSVVSITIHRFKDMMTETLNPTMSESNSTNPSPSEQRKEGISQTSLL